MKEIEFEKVFLKHYKKRVAANIKLSRQFDERLKLFRQGQTGPPLNDHPLGGAKKGMRAFSITGDIRVIYREDANYYIFIDIGAHAQVYQ